MLSAIVRMYKLLAVFTYLIDGCKISWIPFPSLYTLLVIRNNYRQNSFRHQPSKYRYYRCGIRTVLYCLTPTAASTLLSLITEYHADHASERITGPPRAPKQQVVIHASSKQP